MISNLPYGLKDGKLTSIHDVESGLKCDCTCLSCGGQLVARKGKVKAHHFAHYHEENCQGALETALHLAAKEILEEKKEIVLPPITHFDYTNWEEIRHELSPTKRVKLDSVVLEKKVDNFIPDLIAKAGGKELFIEVAVTHFVDFEKAEKVEEKGVSMLEIDLSELKDGFTREELEHLVVETTSNKIWIYNAKEEYLISKYEAKIESIREEKLALIRKEEEARQMRITKKKLRMATARKRGNTIVQYDDVSYQTFCPKRMHESSKKFRSNEFTTPIQNGEFWNGKIYGNGLRGYEEYVFIGGARMQLFPASRDNDLTPSEIKRRKNIFGQLSRIRNEADIWVAEDCENCDFLDEFIDDGQTMASCKYLRTLKQSL